MMACTRSAFTPGAGMAREQQCFFVVVVVVFFCTAHAKLN